MPNHVTTVCQILGPITEIDRFKAMMIVTDEQGKKEFDFNRLIPMPEVVRNTSCGATVEYEDTSLPWTERHKTRRPLTDEERAAGAGIGWYDWAKQNWGTKWGAYSFEEREPAAGRYVFKFETAWSFPTPIFDKLAAEFPLLTFDCDSFDEGWNFAGTGKFNGTPAFEIVAPTDQLYESVYGEKPRHDEDGEAA